MNSDEILARMKARTQNQYDVAMKVLELLATIETLDSEITQHIKVLEVEASILKAKSAYKIRETELAERLFPSDDDSWRLVKPTSGDSS